MSNLEMASKKARKILSKKRPHEVHEIALQHVTDYYLQILMVGSTKQATLDR